MNPLIPVLITGLLLLTPTPPPSTSTEVTHRDDGRTKILTLRNSKIVVNGDVGKGGRSDSYRIKRPCWYEPGLSADEMIKFQTDPKAQFSRIKADESSFKKFIQPFLDKKGQPGNWWTPAYDASDPNGAVCWAGLELFIFVPPNETPPSGITFEQLAEIARAAITVPEQTVKLSPDAKSFVNLPTFVWLEGIGQPRRTATATLPGVMSATVVATLQNIKIDAGTGKDRAEVREQCGATGKPYAKGAAFTCGVQYLRSSIDQPRQVYQLTVTTVWPVTVAGQVPVQFAPVEVGVTRDVPVGEVQSNVRP
ncbi:hypothetical protein [Nonomuraea sp. NEAU-A123]|uniref:hypothetical protein n=1 Tax=Nonomuraea sp. NEAU-A123 TaxID=2839649 RepID=UPI001BE45CCE|nr:hypothetical protein [Nonomuraea sp. NEAU-A123]MBT2224544.1 hypothetical protein [Nonomuraea sp. NEAU-A123]